MKLIAGNWKMFKGPEATRAFCEAFEAPDGVEAVLCPPFVSLPAAVERGHTIFAQNVHWADEGAFTGEVGGKHLRELGCAYAEIGHAERRRVFGETDTMIAAKTAAAFRNRLTPILCVGEAVRSNPAGAARHCRAQLDAALWEVQGAGPLVVAYEPHWAIGAEKPASPEYVAKTCAAIRDHLDAQPDFAESRVIYGGSAGPGLLTRLKDSVDGLFLGRFAHDPSALEHILTEALDGSATTLTAGPHPSAGRSQWQ